MGKCCQDCKRHYLSKHNQYAKRKILQTFRQMDENEWWPHLTYEATFDKLKHLFAMYFNLVDGNKTRRI